MYHCVSDSRDSACESVPSPSPRCSHLHTGASVFATQPSCHVNMVSSLILMHHCASDSRVSSTRSPLPYDLPTLHLIIHNTDTFNLLIVNKTNFRTRHLELSLSLPPSPALKHTLQVWVTNRFVFQHSASSSIQKISFVPGSRVWL